MFKRKSKRPEARMTRVCETCYRAADLFDRPLLTMTDDKDCQSWWCQRELTA